VAVTVKRTSSTGGHFYIDGAPTGTFNPTNRPGSLNNTAAFRVAASVIGGNQAWLGCIDEVEFFRRQLAAQEVLNVFHARNAGKCHPTPTPTPTPTATPTPTLTCTPAPSGYTLWLPFDELAGPTSANLFAGGNNGTQVNNPTVNVGQYVANSLCFNGSNQHVDVPNYSAINPGTGDLSIDAWVRRSSQSGNVVRIIVDKRNPNTGIGYSLAVSYGNLVFQLADASGFTNYRDTGTVPADNRWHFVAVTVKRTSSTGGHFYIDGAPTGTFNPTNRPGSLNNTAAFRVAASVIGGNQAWLGCIDEVEFFRRQLAAQEVLNIFHARNAGKCHP
jgi:hypothetical protein